MKKVIYLLSAVLVFTASTSFAKPITFVVLSDVHYTAKGDDRPMKMLALGRALTPQVLRQIDANKDVDFVVFTGDIFVDPYYPDSEEFLKVLKENLHKPYFVLPGNHDRSTKAQREKGEKVFSLDEFVKMFQGHPYNGKKGYWSVDYNGLHLIGLDSTKDDTWGGEVPKEELSWLKSDLRKHKRDFTIIFAHHTMVEFYPEHDLRKEFFFENSKELLDILKKNRQVKFVVGGHYHFPAAILRDGVHHFAMPSITTYPCEYAIFTVSDDEVKFEAVAVGDPAAVKKGMRDMPKKEDWRVHFSSDDELIDMFRGIKSYSFEPRPMTAMR
jgi:predicted phosphodiesterase